MQHRGVSTLKLARLVPMWIRHWRLRRLLKGWPFVSRAWLPLVVGWGCTVSDNASDLAAAALSHAVLWSACDALAEAFDAKGIVASGIYGDDEVLVWLRHSRRTGPVDVTVTLEVLYGFLVGDLSDSEPVWPDRTAFPMWSWFDAAGVNHLLSGFISAECVAAAVIKSLEGVV